jgi:hypothetical protein
MIKLVGTLLLKIHFPVSLAINNVGKALEETKKEKEYLMMLKIDLSPLSTLKQIINFNLTVSNKVRFNKNNLIEWRIYPKTIKIHLNTILLILWILLDHHKGLTENLWENLKRSLLLWKKVDMVASIKQEIMICKMKKVLILSELLSL